MATIFAPHKLTKQDAEHLAEVTATMQERGAPTIRALWAPEHGVWLALEGSHRLRAAADLDLVPVVQELALDEVVEHDLQDYASPCAVRELLPWLLDMRRINGAPSFAFDDDDLPRGTRESE